MKAVVQVVSSASVTVDGIVVGKIGNGLLCFVGVFADDTAEDEEYIVNKIVNARFFGESVDGERIEGGKLWTRSLVELQHEVLVISQFTLCNRLKGNRFDFHLAMPGAEAELAFENLVTRLKARYIPEKVATGKFAAFMKVQSTNEGPITIILDSKNRRSK